MALPIRYRQRASRSPFRELDDIQAQLAGFLEYADQVRTNAWVPAADIEETDDAFLIETELPGVRREDVTVELDDHTLRVRAELEERERTGLLHRQTRRTGSFDYRVTLPGEVDTDQVRATLADGVLRIEVRKATQATPRRIEIDAA